MLKENTAFCFTLETMLIIGGIKLYKDFVVAFNALLAEKKICLNL